MASSSSAASALPGVEMNRVAVENPPAAVAPPPPPAQDVHAVYLEQLFRVPDRPRRRPPHRELPFIIRTATWVLLIFLLTVMFSFVIWVIFHPNFPELHVHSASMSNVTISGASVTAACNLTLFLTNSNRHLATIYDGLEISLLYPSQRVLLAQDYRASFVQPRKNRMTIEIYFSFTDIYLGNDVVEAIKRDVNGGNLSLGVKVLGIVSYMNGKWKTHSQLMRAYCGELIFGYHSNEKPGVFSNPIVECQVYLYSR